MTNKWVSIKNEMPPDRRIVLLLIETNYSPGYILTGGSLVDGRWKLTDSWDLADSDSYEYSDGSYDDDIAFWMMLPDPVLN
jgi:hypothetical protein